MNSIVKAAVLSSKNFTNSASEPTVVEQAALKILSGSYAEAISILGDHSDFNSLVLIGRAQFGLGNFHDAT